ncbi:MAG: hypothetical protein HY049_04300 [Acidobacteria bacterium]|nr:hypothetical protein [Acidobacteriota bacterium]
MAVSILAAVTAPLPAASPAAPHPEAGPAAAPAPAPSAVESIREAAAVLRPLAASDLTRAFLDATSTLKSIAPRTLLRNAAKTRYYTKTEAASLPEAERSALTETTIEEPFYYNTRYGSPLAYVRPLEILAAAGTSRLTGLRLLDFGYGSIGHLRLMAALGAEVVGVEVDPLLRALYAAGGDQGKVEGKGGVTGSLRLVDGQYPATEQVKKEVGEGFDLIVSKNVLKKGYIHPERPADERLLVHLGVDDETFVGTLHAALRPSGRVLIYNLCPAPAPPDKPYIPWADGRSPFAREMWERAGFRVVAFDADDGPAARAMAHALGWDADLFATFTLVEKPPPTR